MTEPKRPLKVFLCHAHADRDAVRALYTRLTNDGVDAWLDKAKLLPGQDWELEIRKAVRAADVVVVCLSKQFNQAGFRQKEVRLALDTAMEKPEGEIFIIPARLEECENLESLRKWHWVDLFEKDGYEMLMRAFRKRADRIGATLQTKKSWLPNISSSHQAPKIKTKSQTNAQIEFNELDNVVNKPKQKFTLRKFLENNALMFWGVFVLFAIVLASVLFFQGGAIFEPAKTQVVSTSTDTKTGEPSKTQMPTLTLTYKSRGDFFTDEDYGEYIKPLLQPDMRVRAISTYNIVEKGMVGTFFSLGYSEDVCWIVWDEKMNAQLNVYLIPLGLPSDKYAYTYDVPCYHIEIIQ